MTSLQAVCYAMLQTSAISNLVSSRIYGGNRPDTTLVPSINVYEIPGGYRRNSLEYISFSINCRAATAETALTIARKVDDLFGGTDGMGTYGDWNNFGIARASVKQRQGLIPEPDGGIYNAPIDILVIFPRTAIT